MKYKLGIALAVVAVLYLASPVYATDPPDDTPTISNIKANRNLLEEGDALIYGEYYIPYDDPVPTEPADDTYIFRLMDGATEIGVVLPYVLFDKGYNHGAFAFYLEDGDWGVTPPSYTVRISQSLPYFAAPTSWNYAIPSSAYTTKTTKADNQTELTLKVISLAGKMKTYYPEYTFLEDSAGGKVLASPTGEMYFRGAIYGIQAMAPTLFLMQALPVDTTARAWTTDQFDEYAGRYEDTWVETDMEDTADQWGMTPQAVMALCFTFPVCIGAMMLSSLKWRRIEPGLILSVIVIFTCALMGWFPGAIFATLLQLLAIYLAYIWFSSKSHMIISFYTFAWFASVLICIVIEGSYIGGEETTVFNQLIGIFRLDLGNIISIPAATLDFVQGLARIIIWDYSFYSGGYVILRYFWGLTLSPVILWQIYNLFAPIFANLIGRVGSLLGLGA